MPSSVLSVIPVQQRLPLPLLLPVLDSDAGAIAAWFRNVDDGIIVAACPRTLSSNSIVLP